MQTQIQLNKITRVPRATDDLLYSLVTRNAAPNTESLAFQLKNYFTGPINMDLMIAGSLVNSVKTMQNQGVSSWREALSLLGSGMKPLLYSLVYS